MIMYGWQQMSWIKSDKTNYVPAYARDGVGAVSYRMLECPEQIVIAQVDDKGLLSSASLTGISSLLVTSQETFGVNQTLVLSVKVSLRTVVCWGLTIGYSGMLKHFLPFQISEVFKRQSLTEEDVEFRNFPSPFCFEVLNFFVLFPVLLRCCRCLMFASVPVLFSTHTPERAWKPFLWAWLSPSQSTFMPALERFCTVPTPT